MIKWDPYVGSPLISNLFLLLLAGAAHLCLKGASNEELLTTISVQILVQPSSQAWCHLVQPKKWTPVLGQDALHHSRRRKSPRILMVDRHLSSLHRIPFSSKLYNFRKFVNPPVSMEVRVDHSGCRHFRKERSHSNL